MYYFLGFFEERAIVLGKLGRHEQVLSMYVTVLNDVDRATEYCDKVYKSNKENCDQVILLNKTFFFYLFFYTNNYL